MEIQLHACLAMQQKKGEKKQNMRQYDSIT